MDLRSDARAHSALSPCSGGVCREARARTLRAGRRVGTNAMDEISGLGAPSARARPNPKRAQCSSRLDMTAEGPRSPPAEPAKAQVRTSGAALRSGMGRRSSRRDRSPHERSTDGRSLRSRTRSRRQRSSRAQTGLRSQRRPECPPPGRRRVLVDRRAPRRRSRGRMPRVRGALHLFPEPLAHLPFKRPFEP